MENTKSQLLQNLFSQSELEEIIEYFDHEKVGYVNEFSGTDGKPFHDYDTPGSVLNRIVKSKISDILNDSDHVLHSGTHKEYTKPYTLHTDNVASTSVIAPKHRRAFLIPLMEDVRCKTAWFDVFLPYQNHFYTAKTEQERIEQLQPYLTSDTNTINVSEFDNHADSMMSVIPHIPVDQIFTWKMGSAVSFHYNQLHCSTNFAKHGITKRFLVIYIH